VYASAGNYTVNVVVTDNQNATGMTSATVVVNGAPQIATLSGATILSGDTYTENSFIHRHRLGIMERDDKLR